MGLIGTRSWANDYRRRIGVAAFALAVGAVALPALPVSASDCYLGQKMKPKDFCLYDVNGEGNWDWVVSDADGDGIYDTSALDTDYNGKPDTYYTTIGSPDGAVYTRYDHDEDGLKDDEEVSVYGTDPYFWDTDGDHWPDGNEVSVGSSPLDSWCTPLGCG